MKKDWGPRLPRNTGEQVALAAIYRRWCEETGARPYDVTTFGEEFKTIGKRYGLRLKLDGAKLYCSM